MLLFLLCKNGLEIPLFIVVALFLNNANFENYPVWKDFVGLYGAKLIFLLFRNGVKLDYLLRGMNEFDLAISGGSSASSTDCLIFHGVVVVDFIGENSPEFISDTVTSGDSNRLVFRLPPLYCLSRFVICR